MRKKNTKKANKTKNERQKEIEIKKNTKMITKQKKFTKKKN